METTETALQLTFMDELYNRGRQALTNGEPQVASRCIKILGGLLLTTLDPPPEAKQVDWWKNVFENGDDAAIDREMRRLRKIRIRRWNQRYQSR